MIEISNEQIEKVMQGVIDNFLIPSFIESGHNASGKFIASLSKDANENKGYINGNDYIYFIINGRKPNKDQSPEGLNHFMKWAGHYIFKDWVKDKGISANPYAVAYSVAVNGYEGDPTLLNVLQSAEVQDYVYKEMGVYMSGRIKITVQESIKTVFG
jgi:hypothetical protein